MQCRLCNSDAPLRGSHIIPEFFYSGAYDEKHRGLELTRDIGRERFVQKGYRERMLCDSCEGRCNRYETYFKTQWYDRGLLPEHLEEPTYRVEKLDYSLVRLLHLSILWRASASSHAMFRNVSLGPLEDTIRQMLLSDDPGEPDLFHWVGEVLVLDGKVLDGFIFEPTSYKHNGRTIYMFTYGGCGWFFVASKDPVRSWLPWAFDRTGSQVLLRQQVTKDPVILDFLVDFIRRQGGD